MRIVCSVCAQSPVTAPLAVLGEKCAACGSRRISEVHTHGRFFRTLCRWLHIKLLRHFVCLPCGHYFPAGDGGDSHTLCPLHERAARQEANLPPKEHP